MNISFITPTKDRPEDLRRMLRRLAGQSRIPDQVIVVDASAHPIREVVLAFGDCLPVEYVRWEGKPSAAAQRNGGIARIRPDADLVCFFDDDQVLQTDALKRMLAFWEQAEPSVGGAAFNLTNWKDGRSDFLKRSWLVEALGLYSRRPGIVARSGWQSLYGCVQDDVEVEWLGSGMSVWRRHILDEFRFDEFFEGYSYLEDLDFSYSISRRYRLFVVAGALFEHYPSPKGRNSAFRFGRVESRNRIYFVRKHGLSILACLMGISVRSLMTLSSGVLQFSSGNFERFAGNVVGMWDYISGSDTSITEMRTRTKQKK